MNKTEKVEAYGYPSLGLITKFYRECIGDEPLIHIETFLEEYGDHPYKEKGSITKDWDRLCEENYGTYDYYKPDSTDGLIFFVESFFHYMNQKYKLSIPLISLINSTFYNLFDLLKIHNDQPFLAVPDLLTKEILRSSVFSTLIKWAHGLRRNYEKWDYILDYYLSEDLNYSTVLQGIKDEKNQTWEEIYSELDNRVEKEKIKAEKEIAERFETILKDAIQNNKNPTWYNFWILFLWAPDELNIQLLEVYLLNNYKKALKKNFGFADEELDQIKKDFIDYLAGVNEDELFKNYKSINDELRYGVIERYMRLFTSRELYLNKEKDFLKRIKDSFIEASKSNNIEIQHVFDFLEPWLLGYKAVAERRFGDAEKLYKQAFENRYLAGDYILPFLKQAFVLELYNNGKWAKATQAAEPDTNNTNPVCKQAQIYWNYGYALDLFDKPATDTFLESFRIYQNFYNEFPPEMFEHPDNVRKLQIQDLATEMGIFFNDEEIPEQKLDKLYNYICDYEDGDKALNERVKHPYTNKDINKLVIDADEVSPLYYAINRKEAIKLGFSKFMKKLEDNPFNITWKNFDMPGLTTGEKAINRDYRIGKIKNVNIDFAEQIKKYSFTQKYGDEKTFDEQIIQLDKIIEYLVSKTDDLDDYVKSFDNQQGTNSLFLAAEYNDIKVCELLLSNGADPNKNLGRALMCTVPTEYNSYEYVFSNNSFIYRLIFFHSWDMLTLFLTKYKDLAQKSMEPNEYGITPILYFLYYTSTLDNSKELRKQFISKFVKAGADLNKMSILGSAKQIIKMIEYYDIKK